MCIGSGFSTTTSQAAAKPQYVGGNKFQNGDRVVAIEERADGHHGYSEGAKAVVTQADGSPMPKMRFDDGREFYVHDHEDFELDTAEVEVIRRGAGYDKFKEGDRVVLTEDRHGVRKGTLGTITEADGDGTPEVSFDGSRTDYFADDYLELAEDAEGTLVEAEPELAAGVVELEINGVKKYFKLEIGKYTKRVALMGCDVRGNPINDQHIVAISEEGKLIRFKDIGPESGLSLDDSDRIQLDKAYYY